MKNHTLHLCAVSLVACGSIPFTVSAAEPKSSADSDSRPLYRPWTVGLEAGSTGLGGFVSWRFADHWGARTGFDYFERSEGHLGIGSFHYDAKEKLMSEPLTFDIYPWKKNSFHVSVGVLFNQNSLSGTATTPGIILNRVETLKVKIEQQPVNPYLSVGGNLLHFDRAHRFALAGELGVAYTGDPKASLYWSGNSRPVIDAFWRAEKERVKDWADQFTFYPVIKLSVNYSF